MKKHPVLELTTYDEISNKEDIIRVSKTRDLIGTNPIRLIKGHLHTESCEFCQRVLERMCSRTGKPIRPESDTITSGIIWKRDLKTITIVILLVTVIMLLLNILGE